MSITISLRIPEGIVLACDSLATVKAIPVPQEEFVQCPECLGKISYSRIIPPPPTTFAVSNTINKLFCLNEKIGVLSFGVSFITKRSIQSHILDFERSLSGEEETKEITEKLEVYFRRELTCEIVDLSQIPEGEYPLGFQIAGYDEDDLTNPKTYTLKIGQQSIIEPVHEGGYGCTFGGDGRIIQRLWQDDPANPISLPNYQFFSLQDGINYALFLVRTTIDAQKFLPMPQTCGGEIEIAIITPDEGFEWIKSKELDVCGV
ncbi:MAG: hypothetical protein AB1297_07865 [bacterium]